MALPDFRVAQTTHGGHPMIEEKAPTAAQTFLAGQCVALVAAGTVTELADAATAGYGVALDSALDADGNLRATVRVAVFDGNTIFSARNVGAAFVYATHQGDAHDFELVGSTSGVEIGAAGASSMFHALRADPTDSSRVLVTVPAAKSQYDPFGTVAPT